MNEILAVLMALAAGGLLVTELVKAAVVLRPPATLVARVEARLATAKGKPVLIAPRWYGRLSREMITEVAVTNGFRHVGDETLEGLRPVPALAFVPDRRAGGGDV